MKGFTCSSLSWNPISAVRTGFQRIEVIFSRAKLSSWHLGYLSTSMPTRQRFIKILSQHKPYLVLISRTTQLSREFLRNHIVDALIFHVLLWFVIQHQLADKRHIPSLLFCFIFQVHESINYLIFHVSSLALPKNVTSLFWWEAWCYIIADKNLYQYGLHLCSGWQRKGSQPPRVPERTPLRCYPSHHSYYSSITFICPVILPSQNLGAPHSLFSLLTGKLSSSVLIPH